MSTQDEIDDAQTKINELLSRIAALEAEIKQEKRIQNRNIRTLDEYTAVEKICKFDELYNSAMEHLKKVEDTEYYEGDDAHYMFEAIMELLSKQDGPRIWEYYNSLV